MNKKTLKKEARLQSAKSWISNYNGKNLVRGYRKRYGVTLLCAAEELKILGIEVSDQYISQIKLAEENVRKQNAIKKRLKEEKKLQDLYPDSDGTYYFIAGYTSGGAPYGVTWEEMGMTPYNEPEDASDELPF
ncbi:MAG TPA: hypothetical protein VN258_00610 [Mobilitalea sp.]|nr:hypothetical protein [Mobilitalea sp.]